MQLFLGCSAGGDSQPSAAIWDTRFSITYAPGAQVNQIAVLRDKIFIAGNFDSIGGKRYWNGAALNKMAIFDTAWHSLQDGGLTNDYGVINSLVVGRSLTAIDNVLYIGGSFSGLGSNFANNLAQYNSMFTGVGVGQQRNAIQQVLPTPKVLFVLCMNNEIHRFDGISWSSLALPNFPFSHIDAIAMSSRGLVAAIMNSSETGVFLFSEADSSWKQLGDGFGVRSTDRASINELLSDGTSIYARGTFDHVGQSEIESYGLAKWDGTQWNSIGSLSQTTPTAIAMDSSHKLLIAQGDKLMRWNNSSWSTLAHVSGDSAQIHCIGTGANFLVIGGSFSKIDNVISVNFGILR